MNFYGCANYLMCQRILILRVVYNLLTIFLCVLCASVVNPLYLVGITEVGVTSRFANRRA